MTLITDAQRHAYQADGFFVLPAVIPPDHLELLRSECQYFIDKTDRELDTMGTERRGLDAKGKRYFASHAYRERPRLRKFLFSELMADICRATLGPEAYLFWEQYVVKGADPDTAFSWHQDSGYVHPYHAAYLTCWCALDDVTETNGTIYVLPQSVSGIRTWVKHQQDPRTNDLIGYFGRERGVPVICPAGSIAVFSSLTVHRSGPPLTDNLRRAYLAQYSKEIILTADKSKPWGATDPFLKDGQIIGN
jgi:ectoine hydroxylase-related dioxygenase (phytanoyl-CoA dioxygenase family)